jgi:hypothetical protein
LQQQQQQQQQQAGDAALLQFLVQQRAKINALKAEYLAAAQPPDHVQHSAGKVGVKKRRRRRSRLL